MILAVAMTFAIAPVVNRLTSDTTTVVRLKQEVGRGTKITEDQVETVKVKTDTMPQGVYVKTADVVGKYASSTLYAGDILTKAKLSGDSNISFDSSVLKMEPFELTDEVGDFAILTEEEIEEILKNEKLEEENYEEISSQKAHR